MRVISGSAKGRRLITARGLSVRPTSDRVKESLFNIIAGFVPGATVLDLFAGSGALAIEALSRGASFAVLVEEQKAAITSIERNLEATKLGANAVVLQADVITALDRPLIKERAFDLILLDPPYKIGPDKLEQVLKKIAVCLSEAGIVVLEHGRDLPEIKLGEGLALTDKRQYGDTCLSFYGIQE